MGLLGNLFKNMAQGFAVAGPSFIPQSPFQFPLEPETQTPYGHPLVAASAAFIASAQAYEAYCGISIYPMAQKAGIGFVRFIEIPAYIAMQELVGEACSQTCQDGKVNEMTLMRLGAQASAIRKVMESGLHLTAMNEATFLTGIYAGPDIRKAQNALSTAIEAYYKSLPVGPVPPFRLGTKRKISPFRHP